MVAFDFISTVSYLLADMYRSLNEMYLIRRYLDNNRRTLEASLFDVFISVASGAESH